MATDAEIRAAGLYAVPQSRFLRNKFQLPTNTPVVEEEEVTESFGIPNTNAFTNSGGNNSTGYNFGNTGFQQAVDARQARLNDTSLNKNFLGFPSYRQGVTGADAGEYVGNNMDIPTQETSMGKVQNFMNPQSADQIMAEGYQEPRFQPGIIGTMLGKIDNYRNLPRADQAFISQNMGYTGPTIFGENDQIIAVSNDDDTIVMSDQQHPQIDETVISIETPPKPQPTNILMLGWNQHSLTLVQHLSDNTPVGSKIIVAASCNDSRLQVKTLEPRINLNLEHIEIDPTDRIHLEGLPFEIVDHVVILPCYELEFNGKPLTLNQSDANTLITLLNVQHIRQKNKYPLTITSEILNVENRTLVESSDNDDFVLSDYLISLALVQISENKALAPIFNGLFDPDGCEIYLKPITNYVKTNQSISFFTVVEAALMQNETAIGYRISSQSNNSNGLNKKYDTVLNPNKTKMFEFGAEDKIIVLAED